jgi:hypothetical protein
MEGAMRDGGLLLDTRRLTPSVERNEPWKAPGFTPGRTRPRRTCMASSPQRCGNLHRFSDEHRAAGSAVHQGRGALVAIDLPTTFFFAQGRIASTGPGSAPWSILCDNAA